MEFLSHLLEVEFFYEFDLLSLEGSNNFLNNYDILSRYFLIMFLKYKNFSNYVNE